MALPAPTDRPSTTAASRRPQPSGILDSSEATLILTPDGIIDHVSEKACRLLDLTSRPLRGDNFFHRIPRADYVRVAHILSELSTREDGRTSRLLQLKTGLGPWQWFKVEMTPRRCHDDEAGVILRLFERGHRPSHG